MRSLNRVTLIGNLGRDPEIRTMKSGDRVANLNLATTDKWKDRSSGEQKERTEWHRISCFVDALSGIMEQYLHKGSSIYVEGKLETRKWKDQQGQDRYTTEVVIRPFDGKLIILSDPSSGGGKSSGGRSTTQNKSQGPRPDLDDEIPF